MDAGTVALQARIAERFAKTESARSRRWLAFLAEASDVLAGSLDYETTLSSVADLVVPEMADWCAIDILDEGILWPVLLKHIDESKIRWLAELRQRTSLRNEPGSILHAVLHTGRSDLCGPREGASHWSADPFQREAHQLGMQSTMIVPLRARGRVLGVITFASAESGVEYDEIDLAMAEELAGRCALALDNALLHSELKQALAQKEEAISERERLLEELELERQHLDLVLHQMPAGVVMLEAGTSHIAFANARAINLLGLDLSAASPAAQWSCRGFRVDGTPYGDEDWPLVRSLVRGEMIHGEEMQLEAANGLWLKLLVSCLPLRDSRGRIVAALGTFENVTAVRRAEEEMLRQARFLEQFVGILGHDLRNPLQAITGSARVLLRRDLPEVQQKRAAARIASSAERMARMITDLLDFSRSRLGGGIPLVPVSVCLHSLSREIVEELEVANPGRRIELVARGDTRGWMDRDRMAQVIQNLVGNALQYGSQEAPVRVTVGGDAVEVTLSVHNEGPSIPPDALPQLFEPFRRASAPLERGDRPDGLGLGLYITRQIVLAHGGRVDVSSAGDQGTTFTVSLPRTQPDASRLLTS